MKNHWLIDDSGTRREIYEYVRVSLGAPVFKVHLTDDQIDFCIDHAVRHITNINMNCTNCYIAHEENELPEDAALFVAKYYRDLKYRKVSNLGDLGSAVTPAYDWVILYFSKLNEEWKELLPHIKEGALAYSYTLLHNTLSNKDKHYVQKEAAKAIWEHWKEEFAELYSEEDDET